MKTDYGARFEPTQIEVGTGEPGYRWVSAVYIITPDGSKLYPPVQVNEARKICRREGWPILNDSHTDAINRMERTFHERKGTGKFIERSQPEEKP